MSADLTLPGTIPGLLRRGSPCVVAHPGGHWLDGRACTIHALRDGMASAAVDGCEAVVVFAESSLALDLTDRAGISHAGWWLDRHRPRWADEVFFGRLRGWITGEGNAEVLRDYVLRAAAAIRGGVSP